MRRRNLGIIGLWMGLAGVAAAGEPLDLSLMLLQPPPAPPAAPAPPPSTTPPGLTAPPTLAPVTNTAGTAPQSLASSGAGFTPYMMGDLPAASYTRGQVCFPGLVTVVIPPVVVTMRICV